MEISRVLAIVCVASHISAKAVLMPAVSKKRSRRHLSRDEGRPQTSQISPRRRDVPGLLAAIFLALGFAGAALVYDSGADASFDAPKRIVALFAVAAAALAAFGVRRLENPFTGGRVESWRDRRIPLALALFALAVTAASALASPHRALALDSLRTIAITALLLPLGASEAIRERLPFLTVTFLLAAGVDAVVSILQARGAYQPFALVTQGDRQETGAFAGNVGYLALALALAAVTACGIALTSRRPALRIGAAALAGLFAYALLVNRNLTSLSAFGAGLVVLCIGRFGRRALVPLAAGLAAIALAATLYAPMRHRASEAWYAARHGEWDALLSYRTGAWAAAARMARERPLAGFGPGTFGAEFVRHRLDAEIALRRRLTTPLATSTYGEAHCDYLQPFAEEGVPAAIALLAAAGLVVARLVRSVAAGGAGRPRDVVLLAFLTAGATAALTWFPLQRPITALPILLMLGMAWSVPGGEKPARLPEAEAAP